MKCEICREETADMTESTYVSRHYLKNATGQIPEADIGPSLRAVHLDCIEMPHLLRADNLRKWLIWKVMKQGTLIQKLQAANHQLEETLRSHAPETAAEPDADPADTPHPNGA